LKRIVVTGATGFIGRHCLPLLEQKGYEIHAFSTGPCADAKNSLTHWHKIDLFDPKRLKALMAELNPSHLLHLAWYVEAGKFYNSSKNYRWVQASLDLLLNFLEYGGKRVAVAGSCAEYDWKYSYCIEGLTPMKPNTVYGVCKYALQEMFSKLIDKREVSGVWGRIFFLYGPYEHPARLVSSVIRSLLMNRTADCSHGNQIRDFLYVKDVADAFVSLLESNITGPVNIVSGKPCPLKKIIFKIAEKVKRPDLIRLGALETPADDPELLAGDTTRLFKEVGWQPKYSMDQGIEETINWWEHNCSVSKKG
jgi:nucleoside-diphosphate-sugar epimerase